jgi:hypothetical protein
MSSITCIRILGLYHIYVNLLPGEAPTPVHPARCRRSGGIDTRSELTAVAKYLPPLAATRQRATSRWPTSAAGSGLPPGQDLARRQAHPMITAPPRRPVVDMACERYRTRWPHRNGAAGQSNKQRGLHRRSTQREPVNPVALAADSHLAAAHQSTSSSLRSAASAPRTPKRASMVRTA